MTISTIDLVWNNVVLTMCVPLTNIVKRSRLQFQEASQSALSFFLIDQLFS